MNRLIFGADDYLKKWTAKQIGIDGFGPSVSIGVQRDGEIIAAAVCNLPALGFSVCPANTVCLPLQSGRRYEAASAVQ